MSLKTITQKYDKATITSQLVQEIKEAKQQISIPNLAGSALSFLIRSVFLQVEKPLLLILNNKEQAAYFLNDLQGLFEDKDNIEVKTGFAKVLDAATGCLLIKRECLLKMVKKYPDLHYNTDQIIDGKEYKSKNTYLFFDTMKDEDGRYLSEDYAFSRRWQKIGGSIWADLSSDLIHYGQYKFQGQLWKHFNKKT